MTYAKSLAAKEAAELAREAKIDAKANAARAEAARAAEIMKANPQIGMIIRKGKPMYYTGAGDNMTTNIDSLLA